MRLDRLFAREEWAFDGWPDGWANHILAHVLGGIAFYVLGSVVLGLTGWRAAVFPGLCEFARQDVLREGKPRDYPLWAILLDVLTTLVTGAVLARIYG
jgi:hypothetical protein